MPRLLTRLPAWLVGALMLATMPAAAAPVAGYVLKVEGCRDNVCRVVRRLPPTVLYVCQARGATLSDLAEGQPIKGLTVKTTCEPVAGSEDRA